MGIFQSGHCLGAAFKILNSKGRTFSGKLDKMRRTKTIFSFALSCLFLAVSGNAQNKGQYNTFSAKFVESRMVKVNDSLYAGKYETTNEEYNLFVKEITVKNAALYEQVFIDSTKWNDGPVRYGEPLVKWYHNHPAYRAYPVVNISYEGAVEYCKWLTAMYNNSPKRKFNRVEFVLPSSKEWTNAARAGRPQAIYPWSKYYLRDNKGMYLCNFKRINETLIRSDSLGNPVYGDVSMYNDGSFYLAEAKSFNPNDFGLYNVCGNAAEMISEKDLAMGGSWNSYGGEVTTTSVKQYKGRSPEVGFRVFMRVVER